MKWLVAKAYGMEQKKEPEPITLEEENRRLKKRIKELEERCKKCDCDEAGHLFHSGMDVFTIKGMMGF